MRRKIYYKLKSKLLSKALKRQFRRYKRQIGIALLLLFLVTISSSAKQVSILGRYRIKYSGLASTSAYNSMVSQCDSTPWITASGTRCREGVIATNMLPIGTKVMLEGFGDQIFIVEDRMNRRYQKGYIDIWFRSYSVAMKFGRRKLKFYVLEPVDAPVNLASLFTIL